MRLTPHERAYLVQGLRFCLSVPLAVAYASLVVGRPVSIDELRRLGYPA